MFGCCTAVAGSDCRTRPSRQRLLQRASRQSSAAPKREFWTSTAWLRTLEFIYPDCDQGNKHVPAFAEVIVRDPLTLAPVKVGQQGLVQVCSVLPTSFPGFLVLTEDIGEIVHEDGCACGRRGTAFRFVKRVPKAELRGCGNVDTSPGKARYGFSIPCLIQFGQ